MIKVPYILVVDDEESICYVLKLNLELNGYHVATATSAEQALKMHIEKFDLVLLDVMMDGMNGFELAQRMRSNPSTHNIPIIFCTAKDGEDDLVTGFDTGAYDYIKKPFSMKELMARVKSVLKRSGRLSTGDVINYSGLSLDPVNRNVTINGAQVQLSKTEFEILELLLSNLNTFFSRKEILNRVWPNDVYVIDRTVDVNINRIRKKLGAYGDNIATKTNVGYGFTTGH